ncbi:c-type cytochrome domain-containing protein [Stieleria magnilauensis]|uniref:Chromosome partition protein Smc n=1 Tax=Stieleria magnilauensis TaxID=2527963 RepID=A0ABX5Y3H4_9BACT|nr:Chromosome partition protein Smc [Planctomycetes bacterium TBK1r]
MINLRRLFLLSVILSASLPTNAEEKKPPVITFDDHVRPIFAQACASCHNPDKKSADLDLTNYSALMQGGASGEVIEPGDASASYLYALVTHQDEPSMPPESPKIADEKIETLRKWIDGGVLENAGSSAKAAKKKKFDLALAAPSTARPETVPMPARLSLQPVLFTPDRTAIDALATSPWAPLAAVSSQKQVLLYHTETLELLGVLPFPEGTPRVLKFSRNGGLLLCGGGVAGASGRVVVWDIHSGRRIIEIGDELDEVLAADISSDQTLIALGGPQRVVRIYATETGQLLHEIRKHTDWITALEFSPDSVLLATGDRNGGLQVWEGWTGREYLTLKGHTAAVTSVSWRSDSNLLASSCEDSTIRLWEMENGGAVKNWGAHGGGALSVEFTRDGRLFSCGRDRIPKTWDQNGTQQLAFEAFGDLALEATYCDETHRAISGDFSGEIRVHDSTNGTRLGQLVSNAPLLETRLKQADESLLAAQSEFKPISEVYQTAQSALQQISTEVAAAQKVAAEAKQESDRAATALAAAQATMTQAASENAVASTAVDALAISVPMLKEAAEKAAAAAAQLPNDANLIAAAQTIRTTADTKVSEMTSAKGIAATKFAALQQAQQALDSAQRLAGDAAAARTSAEQAEQMLVAKRKPAEDAFNAAKQAHDPAAAAVASARQAVSRWTAEIEFDRELKKLHQQRLDSEQQLALLEAQHATSQEAADVAKSNADQARAELAAAQAELAKNDADYNTAIAAVEAAKAAATSATEAKQNAAAGVETLDQVIVKLGDAAVKAEQALNLASDDATLIALVGQLKSATAEKTKQLEAGRADLVAKTQAEQLAIAGVAEGEARASGLLAMQQSLKQKVAEATAMVTTLETKTADAIQAVQVDEVHVSQSQSNLATINQAIATLQGLSI